jgi:cation diffusion facilitator CzcD-associated flavoprotein CzcO
MIEAERVALRRRYAEERDKRLRPDGNDQYLEFEGQFRPMPDDPYPPRAERDPKRDHVRFAFVGGGFAGLVTSARLKEAGLEDVRIVEKAGGFGGTWYWNRYPGAQCDTSAMIYMPLLVAKLPGIPGLETFEGVAFHTSRWDYAFTGGDPDGAPMDRLADKRVAIIGTGATSVQCVPYLARACGELFVFQRTPSSVDVRDNRPIDPEWFAAVATPGWQERWLENFVANMAVVEFPAEDLVNDAWTDLAKRMRGRIPRRARVRPAWSGPIRS